MQIKLVSVQLTLIAGCLLACNSADKSTSQPTTGTPASVARPDTALNTESVMEHPYAPPPAILSTQKGPGNVQVDLMKAQVTGSMLTVELQYKPGPESKRVESTYALDQISVIDEATAKKYPVLKDRAGNYLAAPLRTDQGKQRINITIPALKDKPVSVWFKFPAPPLDTKTISITIPEVGTYRGIPLSR